MEQREMNGLRVREIARHVAVDVLEDFAKELKRQLAQGAKITPEFVDDAVRELSRDDRY